MQSILTAGSAILALVFLFGSFPEPPLPSPEEKETTALDRRWVYVSRSLEEDGHVEEIADIAKVAAASGFNGIVLSAGFRRIDLQEPEYFERLARVRSACSELGLEIVPLFMSVGYGDGLGHDRNLAAGFPVKDALFVVEGREAQLVEDPTVAVRNPGFEEVEEGRPVGYTSSTPFGEIISVDTTAKRGEQHSLRFEDFDRFPSGSGYLRQEIEVEPSRSYVISCWIRTEGMDPPRPFSLGHIRFEVRGLPDGRRLQFHDPQVPADTDWRQFKVGFNSWGYDRVELAIGNQTSAGGRFWLDDLEIKEVGLVNVLRRPGTPVSVKAEAGGTVYQEGSDYERIVDPNLDHRFNHEGPVIRLLPGSRMRQGEKLRVSWYHSAAVYQRQVTVCMSEPALYDIWRRQARLLHEHLKPRRYLLSMDEVRAGGSCAACKKRNLSMGQILGDCVTRQHDLIKEINPEAELFIWSDMLDPHHNARRNPYYLVDGDFDESWKHVPKDLTMAIWGRRVRPQSFQHFSEAGFRTLGAAYYDADDLQDVPAWLQALEATEGARGIMYTTWLRKYELLPEFGKLLASATGRSEGTR